MQTIHLHGTFDSRRATARRGNTIVLVTAILVLLVIIATAFVGRTRAVRQISAAQQAAAGRDGRGESIAVDVASEIGSALFARPVNTSDPFARTDPATGTIVASSSWPRLAPPAGATRYSIDRDVLPVASAANPVAGDGIPDFPYNIAPFETKAWTNWPDFFGGPSPWPFGPGSPQGALTLGGGVPMGDANPFGNPGTGDSRWLRSTEPERIGLDQTGDGVPDLFDFSHWSHLSWLPRAENAWRVVYDIADIQVNTIENLNEAQAAPYAVAWPYEQWLPGVVPATISNANEFILRRDQWFSNYPNVYRSPAALPNFFSLKLLGRPTDEFVFGSNRNVISRTFTDTDGDGFTDSFWFTAPIGVDRGIRTIVGVSVVDNSALLNANVATKFGFNSTTGQTPADLALVSSVEEFQPFTNLGTTVGFFDGPVNQPGSNPAGSNVLAGGSTPSPNPTYWTGVPALAFPSGIMRYNRAGFGDFGNEPESFLEAIGLRTANGGIDSGNPAAGYPLADATLPTQPNPYPRGAFESARERLAYYKLAGLDSEQPLLGVTPFDASDEFELRAFHGNNLPFTLSRFEQAVSLYSPGYQGGTANDFQFLRSSPMREEADEYLDQLNSRQLLVDNRRKLTLFNGARNETAPPWLWPTPYYEETVNYMNPGGAIPAPADPNFAAFDAANRAEYARQTRKVDLRAPMFVDAAGNPNLQRNPFAAFQWRRDLARVLEASLAKISYDASGAPIYQTFFGTREADYRRTMSMIASFVANIDTASDEPQTLGTSGVAIDRPLYPSNPQQDPNQYFAAFTDAVPDPFIQNRFYLGMEKQPYIMEVFFGLVYPKSDFNEAEWLAAGGQAPPGGADQLPPDVEDGGENFVDSTSQPKAVIAVQIANPYDTPISLGDFRLRLFGQNFSFAAGGIAGGYGPNPVLPAATLGRPSTAIVYAIAGGAVGDYPDGAFKAAVLDFLDIERGETNGGSLQQTDLDGDGLIEYATLYDARGVEPAFDSLDRTLVFDATGIWRVDLNAPATGSNAPYDNAGAQPVEIVRNILPPPGIAGGPLQIVVDRFDNEFTGPEVEFNEAMNRLFTDQQFIPPEKNYFWDSNPQRRFVAGIRLRDNDFFMTWCRASRLWAFDLDTWDDTGLDPELKTIDAVERSPRYAFSMATEPVRSSRQIDGVSNNGARLSGAQGWRGDIWQIGQDPDGDGNGAGRWVNFTFMDQFGRQLRGKPVFFSNQLVVKEGTTEVVGDTDAGNPIPFLANFTSQADFLQDCHGHTEYDGAEYHWVIGSKGCSPQDWQRFANEPLMNLPFQMTQKDTDFEQIGEVLDVFLRGHVFEGWGGNPQTVRTFSEIMLENDPDDEFYPGQGLYTNRLQVRLVGELGPNDPGSIVLGAAFDPLLATVPPTPLLGYEAWKPALPAGIAFLDALTIDGPGRNTFDRNGSSGFDAFDAQQEQERRFTLAHGYLGKATPGLINLNTAMPEVMQALPYLTRLPRETVNGITPYSHAVDAIRAYRDQKLPGAPTPFPVLLAPSYADRGLTQAQVDANLPTTFPTTYSRFFPGMRNERGFASIGELALLGRIPEAPVPDLLRASYSMRWLGLDPYLGVAGAGFDSYPTGYSWATDRTFPRPRQLPADILAGIGGITNVPTKPHDEPLGDAEDLNLLFKGISNLVTTRSDVFTVYLRVRQVKQNPVNGKWNGTDKESILDDSRYVMCVDRSNVNAPGDQPRIIYFQKCP